MSDQVEPKDAEQEAKELYEKNREYILQLVQDGKLPEPRKLNRKQRRALDAAKVNIFKIEPTDTRTYFAVKEALSDWVIENVYPDFDFDDIDNNTCLFFGEYIFGLSYKNDLTAKN